MTDQTTAHPKLDYDAWARTVPADNLWAQVRRTVGGRPVPESDIDLIVDTIVGQLALSRDDAVLDLACGNGALASRFFSRCRTYLGSDLSPYLIGIAQARFADAHGQRTFKVAGAAHHVCSEPDPVHFTKALCYGSFAYFTQDEAASILAAMFARFTNVTRFFIGNLPDLDRAALFYGNELPSAAELSDPQSRIGIWRTRDTFAQLAEAAGWQVAFSNMPAGFFAAHYRYDALLQRP